MKNRRRENMSYLALGILCGALAACLIAAFAARRERAQAPKETQTRVLKLAHGLESTHPVHLGMLKFKEVLEEMSGGKLSVDIYGGGALGSEIKCTEQVKNGALDMAKNSASPMSVHVPVLSALAMPYLFKNSDHYWRVLDSEIGREILDGMAERGFVGLCFYDAGARSFYTVKKPVESPEDLKGLKIRVMNSRSDIALMRAFGASPTVISAGERHTRLWRRGLPTARKTTFPHIWRGHTARSPNILLWTNTHVFPTFFL